MYRNDDRPAKRAAWSKTGTNYKARAVQADVTVNLNVRDNDPKHRAEWTRQLKDDQRMGAFSAASEVNILRGDLVFIGNRDSRVVRSKLPFAVKGYGIVSFQAMPLIGAQTDEQFAQRWKFAGVAKVPYLHGQIDQPDHGISVQHNGATSVPNNGRDEFYPNDAIMAEFPPIDPLARQKWLQENACRFRGLNPNRLHAVPARVSYADTMKLMTRATGKLFRGSRPRGGAFDAQMSLRKLRPPILTDISQVDLFASNLKRSILQDAWNTAAVLQAYGLVTFNMPIASSPASANSLDKTLLNTTLTKLLADNANQATVTVDSTTGRTTFRMLPVQTDRERELRLQQLDWLALKLDLIWDESVAESQRVAPSQSLIDAFVATSLNASFTNPKLTRMFDARRFRDRGTNPDSIVGVSDIRAGRRLGRQNFGAQIAKSQADAKSGFYNSSAMAKAHIDARIIGSALNHSRPGGALDILM